MEHAFLSVDETGIAGIITGEKGMVPKGAYAREKADPVRGHVSGLRSRPASKMKAIRCGRVVRVPFDPETQTKSKVDWERDGSGKIKITSGEIRETATITPIAANILADRAAARLPGVQATALVTIDRQAEAAREGYITTGSGQAMVYERKRAEAARWAEIVAASGTPVPANFPLLKARAERLNAGAPDYQTVADEWNAKAALWIATAADIENVREGAKEAVMAQGVTEADVQAILAGLVWPSPA